MKMVVHGWDNKYSTGEWFGRRDQKGHWLRDNSKCKSVGINIDVVYKRVGIVAYSGGKFNSIE